MVEDLAEADPVRHRHRPVLGRRAAVPRTTPPGSPQAGAVVVDNSSAWRMHADVPLVVAGVNDHAASRPPGDHRQPQLHDDGADDGGGAAASGGRARPTGRHLVPVGVGNRARRPWMRWRPRPPLLRQDPEALRTGAWVDPGLSVYSRPIAWNVLPLAGESRRPRATPTRSGNWSTRPARSSSRPDPGGADLCAGAGDGGPRHRRHGLVRARRRCR